MSALRRIEARERAAHMRQDDELEARVESAQRERDEVYTDFSDRITELTVENDKLRKYAHEATKAITGLVGGGSEMFAGRIGGMYKADLTYCVDRLQDRARVAHRHVVDAILAEKKARRQADGLIAAAKQAAAALGKMPDTKATTDAYAALVDALAALTPSTPSAVTPVSLTADHTPGPASVGSGEGASS